MLIGLITAIHIAVCIVLILVVLLQKGKGQDFASTFGGGGTQTAFGARSGATILHRATTAAAVVFMLTSLTLTILMSRGGQDSVLGGVTTPVQIPEQPEIQLQLPEVADPVPAEEAPADVEAVDPAGTDAGQED